MNASDWLGLTGSMLILIAPGRDQLMRLIIYRNTRQADASSAFREIWKKAGETREKTRNTFNFWDSLSMALGAILLAISFII